jgi:hypothetical protein
VSKRVSAAILAGLLGATPVAGAERIGVGPAHLFVGGEASAALSEKDRGYFNAEDYGDDTLRLVRLRLTLELRAGEQAAALAEIRHTNTDSPRVYALYLRLRPWRDGPVDLQAGIVPPVFGAFPRRAYAADNPLIGLPLGYQYLTALRPDAGPRTPDELLSMRGWGWAPYYPSGSRRMREGLPLVQVGHWDAGVQARFKGETVEAAVGVGQGSPSDPRTGDNNDGKSVQGRVAWTPVVGLLAGVSAAQGRYLDEALERPAGTRGLQRVWGADLEYSRGYWVLRAEGLRSSWDAPWGDVRVAAWAAMVEARLKVAPGLSVAARADRLSFDRVASEAGRERWEFPVTRLEGAWSISLHRQATLKLALQHDRRDGGPVRRQTFLAAQAVAWF